MRPWRPVAPMPFGGLCGLVQRDGTRHVESSVWGVNEEVVQPTRGRGGEGAVANKWQARDRLLRTGAAHLLQSCSDDAHDTLTDNEPIDWNRGCDVRFVVSLHSALSGHRLRRGRPARRP